MLMNKRTSLSIDWNNLFVSSTLHDELLLFSPAPDETFRRLCDECAFYGIDIDRHRALESYSGGEQAIICCLFLCALLPKEPLDILFVHLLETLSPNNRQQILAHFRKSLPLATLDAAHADGKELLQ